jgi:hypothetical protein
MFKPGAKLHLVFSSVVCCRKRSVQQNVGACNQVGRTRLPRRQSRPGYWTRPKPLAADGHSTSLNPRYPFSTAGRL